MELHITKDQERVLDTWLHDYEKLELRSMWAKEMFSSTEVSAFTKWVEKKSAAFILAYFKKKGIKEAIFSEKQPEEILSAFLKDEKELAELAEKGSKEMEGMKQSEAATSEEVEPKKKKSKLEEKPQQFGKLLHCRKLEELCTTEQVLDLKTWSTKEEQEDLELVCTGMLSALWDPRASIETFIKNKKREAKEQAEIRHKNFVKASKAIDALRKTKAEEVAEDERKLKMGQQKTYMEKWLENKKQLVAFFYKDQATEAEMVMNGEAAATIRGFLASEHMKKKAWAENLKKEAQAFISANIKEKMTKGQVWAEKWVEDF